MLIKSRYILLADLFGEIFVEKNWCAKTWGVFLIPYGVLCAGFHWFSGAKHREGTTWKTHRHVFPRSAIHPSMASLPKLSHRLNGSQGTKQKRTHNIYQRTWSQKSRQYSKHFLWVHAEKAMYRGQRRTERSFGILYCTVRISTKACALKDA